MPTAHSFKATRSGGMILFLVLGLGLSLRLVHIDAPLSSDELTMLSIWAQMPFFSIPENYQYPNNHIFLTLILNVLLKIFGVDPFILRLPVLLCGVLSLLFGFLTTKRMTGNFTVASGVALLLAISTNHIYYSTNARGYMLVLLFSQLTIHWTVRVFYDSATGAWVWPRAPFSKRDLIFLLTFCLMGTWTLPTFVFFEGSLLVFFGFFLVREIVENRNFQNSAPARIIATLWVALAGFGVQYFVLIPREILEIAMTRAPLTPVRDFIPGIWRHWVHPLEPATPILIVLWAAGLWTLYREQKVLFALFVSLILMPPAVILWGHFIGWLKWLPAPRVFLYMQPYFFMGVAIGGYEVIAKILQFTRNRLWSRASAFSMLPVFYFLCFLPAGYQAGRELSETVFPKRMSREPFHEMHRFIKNSGPHDLFLVSNRIHVEFFLYGAREMLTRVKAIIDSGQLENIYFIGSALKGRADIELMGDGENAIYQITDYSVIGAHDASQPFTLPGGVMKKVFKAGNLTVYKIRRSLIRKVTALNTPEEIGQWNFAGEPQKIALEPIQTKTGERLGLRFRRNFTMASPPLKAGVLGAPVMTLKFLTASNSDQPLALYLDAVTQEGSLQVSPAWLANAWTLDHPYGAKIYSRRYRPWIFISNVQPFKEVIQTNLPDAGAPRALWGVQSYVVTAPLAGNFKR